MSIARREKVKKKCDAMEGASRQKYKWVPTIVVVIADKCVIFIYINNLGRKPSYSKPTLVK